MNDAFFSVTPSRVCEHCKDSAKEAFPYGVLDKNGKHWEILCNDCFEALGCEYPHDEDMRCPTCGCGMEWQDCWNGCDEGYLSLYDEDPLWYDEDDTEVCSVCDGRGGWWVCPEAEHHAKEPTP